MSQRNVQLYIQDMITALERIDEYTRPITHADDFIEDKKTVDAVVRNLAILGEATGNIPEEIKKQHTDILWDKMKGMRDKVIHEYFGVDTSILWHTIQEDLPPLREALQKLLSAFS